MDSLIVLIRYIRKETQLSKVEKTQITKIGYSLCICKWLIMQKKKRLA